MKLSRKKVSVPVDKKSLFRQYLSLTKPIHGLRPKEMDVLALLLYYNMVEGPNFKREEDRWKKVFDYDTKLKVREELDIEDYSLQNILSSLRKKGAVVDNQISKYYIPSIADDTEMFQIIFEFKINE